MNRKQKADLVATLLDKYVPNPKIPLKHKDAFTLLIAVLLSAQATDKKVNEITPALFKLASTPKKMSEQSLSDIEKIIRPIGLYKTKAKAIKNLSKILVEKFHSKVPKTFEELESLPGVGHKTASVVMCHAFDVPAFPVDTHIFRNARRWGLSSAKTVKKTEEDLKTLFPKKDWNKLHLQIITYSRQYCPAKAHKIEKCPICSKLHQAS